MKQLYFVRHGESQANIDRVYAGQAETPLTRLGISQAVAAGQAARQFGIDYIVSSPTGRAYDTALAITKVLGLPPEHIEKNALLMERDYGSLVGKSWDFSVSIDNIEGVESIESILERGRLGYEYVRALPYENILIVSHGTYWHALCKAMDPAEPFMEGAELPNAQIVQLL